MANEEHLAILQEALDKDDIEIWNKWRADHHDVKPDLSNINLHNANLRQARLHHVNLENANLYGSNLTQADLIDANLHQAALISTDLSGATLIWANLTKADLHYANLYMANLRESDLTDAILTNTDLYKADLTNANLAKADLSKAYLGLANLTNTILRGANLTGVILKQALLVKTDFRYAILDGCHIYGISAWDIKLDMATQKDLNISEYDLSPITVDNLKIAQFIYLLLNNAEIRDVIDTIATKAVLILGRFTDERKVILDAIKDDLRKQGFLPILFDFKKSDSRDLTETVRTLAHLSRFVIADLTDARSIIHELANIVPQLPSVPVKPIILIGNQEYAMIEHLYRYPWMLPAHEYESQDKLLAELAEKVIQPAQEKAEEMKPKS